MAPEGLATKGIRTFKDLEVYAEGFRLAQEIFELTQAFPKEELYALTTQMRSASRSIPANIAEGWAKRRHIMVFKRHLLDALGSVNETIVWLDTALACRYVSDKQHQELMDGYARLGRQLHQLLANWKTY